MISDEEIRLAMAQIVEYCERYEGSHGEEILSLYEQINELLSLDAESQHGDTLKDVFFGAISALLMIAAPPGIRQYEAILSSLSELSDSSFSAIAIDPAPLSPFSDASKLRLLHADLPPSRDFEPDELVTISYFESLVSEGAARRGDMGGWN